MINAEAIAAVGLVRGDTPAQRFERILDQCRLMRGEPNLTYDEAMYRSEMKTREKTAPCAI